MFSKEKPEQGWPAVPPSLNHDSFELNDAKREPVMAPAPPDTAGSITPYLGLRARLSQIWINRWTILLILVLVRMMILIAGLHDDIGEAKAKALSACTQVEDIGSAMASMPHYLSVGVNQLTATGIEKAVDGMVDGLMMILTGVEAIILFVIDFYVGTYVCLIAALIHGGLDLMVQGVTDTTNFMNSAINTITGDIDSAVQSIQNDINKAFSAISDTAGFLGQDFTPPKIDLSSEMNDLKNIHVNSTQFAGDLTQLNHTIPTFNQVQNYTKEAISIPFNMVKQVLNSTWGAYQFDQSVFPVAQKEALTFCSDNDKINDFFQNLYKIAADAKIIFIVVLCVLAVLACVPMTWLEIRRYRRQQRHAQVFTQHGFDPMDVVYIASRPMTATAGIKIASKFSGKRQLLVRWAVAYGTSFPALFILSLAIAGFFSCLCTFLVMHAIQKEAPALASEVGNFADTVVNSLEDVSKQWANDTNGVITHFNNEINNDILGYVVNATTAVNNTLNTFQDDMNKALNDVFGGTPLEVTINGVVACLIGMKIDAVEKGLTWVHNNAHVDFPLLPNDIFAAGANQSLGGDSLLAAPSSSSTDEIDAAVNHVINLLHNSLIQEALISLGLLLVYVIVVLLGIVRALAGMATPDRTRAEGGQRYQTGEGREPLSPRSQQRSRSEMGMRFPRFDSGDNDASVVMDDCQAASARDEKIALAQAQQRVPAGKGAYRPGHWRGSSYGDVEDVNK